MAGYARSLTDAQRAEIRAIRRKNLVLKKRMAEIDLALMALMDERDEIRSEFEKTTTPYIAEQFGISQTQVHHIIRPRSIGLSEARL
jgi:seryl-tRNA synthetase